MIRFAFAPTALAVSVALPSPAIVFGPSVPVAVTVPVGRSAPASVAGVARVTLMASAVLMPGYACVDAGASNVTVALFTVNPGSCSQRRSSCHRRSWR